MICTSRGREAVRDGGARYLGALFRCRGAVPAVKSDQWFHALFQVLPDLICPLLDAEAGAGDAAAPGASPAALSEPAYRFSSPELKSGSHRLDGLLWPRAGGGGSPRQPVVILEVQMHPDRGFHHRLAAETFRFLQQHPQVEHLRVVVLLAHDRLRLGSRQPDVLARFLGEGVTWISLEAMARAGPADPLLALLTLPVQPEPDLGPCCQRILAARPELLELILPMLAERFARLTDTEILAMIGIPLENYRHTRLAQGLLQEGMEKGRVLGRQAEAAALCLRLLRRRCGELPPATVARIEALALDQLEELADSLLEFSGVADLQRWLDL
jgi:predicted transposase YdaD